jgi:hypothetical protein
MASTARCAPHGGVSFALRGPALISVLRDAANEPAFVLVPFDIRIAAAGLWLAIRSRAVVVVHDVEEHHASG